MTPQPNSSSSPEQGFTLVEVLVGSVVVIAFVGTTMQALLTATLFRVKGQELSEATNWINEDLEMVKYKATQLAADSSGQACKPTAPSQGYATLLDQSIPIVNANKVSAMGGRPYTLTRTETPSGTAPYNVLEVTYTVTSASGEQTPPREISKRIAKVIPNVALACP